MGTITNPKGIAPPRAKKHGLNTIYCDLSPKPQTGCSLMNRQQQGVKNQTPSTKRSSLVPVHLWGLQR